MSTVNSNYLNQMPDIYRDILAAFPQLEPARKARYALAFQTLFEGLSQKYSLGQIIEACKRMADGGAVQIKNNIFVSPTELGEEIIEGLTGKRAGDETVPPFSPPM